MKNMRHDTRPYLLFIWLTIAITFILIVLVQSADGAGGEVYLPIVQKADGGLRITGADCGYIFIDAVSYPIELDTSYYAGAFTVRRYPSLPMETGTLHHWYMDGDTVRYWGSYQFEVGVLYYLDAWVKTAGGGLVWVANGDQLWMPCQPH